MMDRHFSAYRHHQAVSGCIRRSLRAKFVRSDCALAAHAWSRDSASDSDPLPFATFAASVDAKPRTSRARRQGCCVSSFLRASGLTPDSEAGAPLLAFGRPTGKPYSPVRYAVDTVSIGVSPSSGRLHSSGPVSGVIVSAPKRASSCVATRSEIVAAACPARRRVDQWRSPAVEGFRLAVRYIFGAELAVGVALFGP